MQDLRDMQLIGDDLQQFQQNIQLLRKMSDQFCEQPTPAAQAQVRAQLDVVNQLQRRINARLESAGRDIDSMPRPQQARPRATHAKLRKDFERVSATLGPIVAKVEMATERMLNATQQRSAQGAPLPGSSAARRGMGQSAAHDRFQGGESGGFGDLRGDAYDAEPTQPSSVQLRMQQDGAEIEEAILREREEEIREINQNVHKVNEIFRDLATIVNKQQDDVDDIAEMTEKSHKSAQAGLEQVQKAAKLQPSCAIS